MTITNKLHPCNSASNALSLGVGNIVPHWWYKEIRAAGDKPDLVAITILSELYFLHRRSNGAEFNDGYTYFERKFDFTRSQLKDAIIRLDKAGLAVRSFRTIIVHGRNFPNELHLKINLPKLLQLKTKYINASVSTSDFDNNSGDGDSSNNEEEEVFSAKVCGNSVLPSTENSSEHIGNRNISIRRNRSNESSFFKNSFKDLSVNRASLATFYPLSQSDVALLQQSSGREFTLIAVNEILLKLAKKHNLHSFPNKQAFMAYMTKVLLYEMRDAVKISSVDFKLNCNKNKEEIQQHRYLEKVEYNRNTSKESILRRKIAAVLDSATAYQLLKSMKSYGDSGFNKNLVTEYTISLSKAVDLSSLQKQLVLEQVRAVYSEDISSLKLAVESLSITPIITQKSAISDHTKYSSATNSNIWNTVRSMMITHYGENGHAIDQNWFSKLVPEIDVEQRNITLRASSNFIKDWVLEKYSLLLDKFFQSNDYNLVGIV
jgi:hypothetical protein